MKAYWSYVTQLGQYLYHRSLARLAPLARRLLGHPGLAVLTQKLAIEKQYRLDIGHPDRIVILLVGCGGTGSWAAHVLAQLAVWAKGAGIDLRLYFVDHDHVEEKNLVRQNFCPAEVGYPKAFSLAWRYTAALGLTITPVVEQFSAELLDRYKPAYSPQGTLTLVIGAVDNVCARRQIAEALTAKLKQNPGPGGQHKYFWLDAGNERFSGQILIGNSLEPEPLLSPLGYCIGLPLPHLQEPGLLMDRERPSIDLSCADLNLLGEQSAMINRAMATWIGLYLYRLLQSRDLCWSSSWLNLETGLVRSGSISGGRVVAPTPPQRITVTTPETPPPEPETMGCPNCGGTIIQGEDEWAGVRVGVRFCDTCTFREEFCPECGGTIVEAQSMIDNEPIPSIYCMDCGWHEPIPPQSAPAPTAVTPEDEEAVEAPTEAGD
jgi:PRTRC genetic system ThiF family protein